MALIGSSIDPRMFVQDYSGFADAARIQGAGMANFGNQIGGAIADYGEQQKEAKAGIAKGKAALQFAKTLKPELADQIDQLGAMFNDPSKSQVELSAIGSQMGDYVAAMIGEERYKDDIAFRRAADKRAERGLSADIEQSATRNKRAGEAHDISMAAAEIDKAIAEAGMEATTFTGPMNLDYALSIASSDPKFADAMTAERIQKLQSLSPPAQDKVAANIIASFTPDQKWEFENLRMTNAQGQTLEVPSRVDTGTGIAEPLKLPGQMPAVPSGGPSDALLPPADPNSPMPAAQQGPGQGLTMGGKMQSPKETPQELITKNRMVDLDKTLSTVRDQGMEMAQDIAGMERAVELLDEVKTGFTKETQMKAKRALGADVANEEEFLTLAGKFVMSNIALTKGAISDKEMAYFKGELSPNMGKSTEGNKRIINFKLNYAKRAQQIGDFIAKAQAAGMDPFAIRLQVDQYINDNPLTPDAKEEAKAASPVKSVYDRYLKKP